MGGFRIAILFFVNSDARLGIDLTITGFIDAFSLPPNWEWVNYASLFYFL